jgi:hypothetical protein
LANFSAAIRKFDEIIKLAGTSLKAVWSTATPESFRVVSIKQKQYLVLTKN